MTETPSRRLPAAYLVDKRPAAFMRGSLRTRLEFALALIRDFDVSGVLWYQLLCCEFYDEEAYYFEMALRERGIPMLVVESDYHALDSGPLRTRLAAFVETLQGGRSSMREFLALCGFDERREQRRCSPAFSRSSPAWG